MIEILLWDKAAFEYKPFSKQFADTFDFIDAELEFEINRVSVFDSIKEVTVWVTAKEGR